MKRWLSIMVLIFAISGSCKSINIDSIAKAIAHLPHTDTLWLKGNYKIAREFTFSDLPRSISMSETGYELAQQIGSERLKYLYLFLLGTNYQYNQSYEKSIACFQKAIPIAQKLKRYTWVVDCYTNIANTYNNNSMLDKAMDYNLKAVDFGKKYAPDSKWGTAYMNIAAAYIQMNDVDNGLKYTKLSLTDTSLGPEDLLYTYANLCSMYAGTQQLDSASRYVNLVKELNRTHDLTQPDFSNCSYAAYVDYDVAKGFPPESKEDMLTLLETSKVLQDSTKIGIAYLKLSDYFLHYNQYDSSTQAIILACEYTKNSGDLHNRITMYDRLSANAVAMHNTEEALRYAKIARSLTDSFYLVQNAEAVHNAEIKFATKEKEEKNKLLAKENNLKTRQKNIILVGGLGIAAVLSLFLWSNFRSRRRTENLNKKIEEQNTALAESNSTKDKIFSIISHDLRAPIAGLSSLVMLKESGLTLSLEKQEELDKKIKMALHHTSSSLDNLLLWSIAQMKQDKIANISFSLNEVIQSQIDLLQPQGEAKGLRFDFNAEKIFTTNNDKNGVAVIIRNILSNAIKFSYSNSSIAIRTKEVPEGKVCIVIQDYGVGMSEAQVEQFKAGSLQTTKGTSNENGTGLGFLIIQDYCNKINAHITVESKVGEGSTFRFVL
jgi:signal transduction histidine kinase